MLDVARPKRGGVGKRSSATGARIGRPPDDERAKAAEVLAAALSRQRGDLEEQIAAARACGAFANNFAFLKSRYHTSSVFSLEKDAIAEIDFSTSPPDRGHVAVCARAQVEVPRSTEILRASFARAGQGRRRCHDMNHSVLRPIGDHRCTTQRLQRRLGVARMASAATATASTCAISTRWPPRAGRRRRRWRRHAAPRQPFLSLLTKALAARGVGRW